MSRLKLCGVIGDFLERDPLFMHIKRKSVITIRHLTLRAMAPIIRQPKHQVAKCCCYFIPRVKIGMSGVKPDIDYGAGCSRVIAKDIRL